ncbi:MAG: ECF transporter S component [Lachnospiraceae bacterium]|nr:ECF transporter S component [Lachnospiraceae bacterium]
MSTSNTKKLNVTKLVETAVLIAIVLVMGNTILGTIQTPLLSVSLVTIPVAVAAIVVGPIGGLCCGAAFGINSFVRAVMGLGGMTTILFGINPVGMFITAVVMRCLVGLLVGYIFKALKEKTHLGKISYYIGALCAPLLNTLLFMTSLCLFFYNTDYIQELASGKGAANPIMFVIILVGIQGVVEAIAGLIIGGSVSLVLDKISKNA